MPATTSVSKSQVRLILHGEWSPLYWVRLDCRWCHFKRLIKFFFSRSSFSTNIAVYLRWRLLAYLVRIIYHVTHCPLFQEACAMWSQHHPNELSCSFPFLLLLQCFSMPCFFVKLLVVSSWIVMHTRDGGSEKFIILWLHLSFDQANVAIRGNIRSLFWTPIHRT